MCVLCDMLQLSCKIDTLWPAINDAMSCSQLGMLQLFMMNVFEANMLQTFNKPSHKHYDIYILYKCYPHVQLKLKLLLHHK